MVNITHPLLVLYDVLQTMKLNMLTAVVVKLDCLVDYLQCMDELRYVIIMCGLEYVPIISIATIYQVLFVESSDTHTKVIILHINIFFLHKLL